jgi:hypothetical protein
VCVGGGGGNGLIIFLIKLKAYFLSSSFKEKNFIVVWVVKGLFALAL